MNRTKAAIIALISSFFTTILPYVHNKSTYIALRAPYVQAGFKRHGALITVKTAAPENILLQAYLYDPLSGSKELRGSIYLNSSAIRKPFLYDSASFNPLSKAEYRIYAYIIDPDTKKIVSPIDTIAHIIAVRDIPSARLPASVSYTPFLLKRALSTQEKTYLKYTALVTGIVLFVAGAGLALHYHLKKKQEKNLEIEQGQSAQPSINNNVNTTNKQTISVISLRQDAQPNELTPLDSKNLEKFIKHASSAVALHYQPPYMTGAVGILFHPTTNEFIDQINTNKLIEKFQRHPNFFTPDQQKLLTTFQTNIIDTNNEVKNRYYTPVSNQKYAGISSITTDQKIAVLRQQRTLLTNLLKDGYNNTSEYHAMRDAFNQGFQQLFPKDFDKKLNTNPLFLQEIPQVIPH